MTNCIKICPPPKKKKKRTRSRILGPVAAGVFNVPVITQQPVRTVGFPFSLSNAIGTAYFGPFRTGERITTVWINGLVDKSFHIRFALFGSLPTSDAVGFATGHALIGGNGQFRIGDPLLVATEIQREHIFPISMEMSDLYRYFGVELDTTVDPSTFTGVAMIDVAFPARKNVSEEKGIAAVLPRTTLSSTDVPAPP